MKFIPQIRNTIHKWLELQNSTWYVTVRSQYGVKPPCTAIRASQSCGMESKRVWICSWGISLHAILQSVKSGCWRTKLPINHMLDMFDGRYVRRTCWPGKPSLLEESLHNPRQMWSVEHSLLKCGMWICLKEGQCLGLQNLHNVVVAVQIAQNT